MFDITTPSKPSLPSTERSDLHVPERGGTLSELFCPLPLSIHLFTSKQQIVMRLLWLPLLLFGPVIQAAVLAIDYGAEFTKLSLVKPGVPFDVILDRDSKRKISSVVGWKREDRVFGAEGKMSVSESMMKRSS
jgi:hypothetical protein